MKKFKPAIYLLMLLSVVITAVLLQFMPDIVPAHYNAAGVVDRLDSKYAFFLFPAITVFIGLFFQLVDRFVATCGNEEERAIGSKILGISAIVTELFFIALGGYFMGKGIAYGHSGTASVPGIDLVRTNSICTILIGALLIVLGNYMPKARKNSLFGLRTVWSMANDRVWQKSQRFGGILSVICGAILIFLGIFVKKLLMLRMLLTLTIWVITAVAASYVFRRRDGETHG